MKEYMMGRMRVSGIVYGQKRSDLLNPTASQVRKGVKNIDRSYDKFIGILQEAVRDSTDAIIELPPGEKGKIEIEINAHDKYLFFKDNGDGFNRDKREKLLVPNESDKENKLECSGEFGTGTTFLMHCCNEFKVKSCNNGIKFGGRYLNGLDYVNNKGNYVWESMEDGIESNFVGTEIELSGVEDLYLFDLNFIQTAKILRTYTSIGSVKKLYNEIDREFEIKLTFVNKNNERTEDYVEFGYMLPWEGLKEESIISYDEALARIDEIGTENKIKIGREFESILIYKIGHVENTSGRKIKCVYCFAPNADYFERTSREKGLYDFDPSSQTEENWIKKNENYVPFKRGIFTACKGVPTLATIELPMRTGGAGWWEQIFILFDDDDLDLRIGRNSIGPSQKKFFQDQAKKIFNDTNKIRKYFPGRRKSIQSGMSRDEVEDKQKIIDKIKNMPDMKIKGINYTKIPHEEQDVVAIFNQFIAKQNKITVLYSSTATRYDSYVQIRGKDRIYTIEHKKDAGKLVKNLQDGSKNLSEIDCLVCWEITDRVIKKFKEIGMVLEEKRELSAKDKYFPYTTHVLRWEEFEGDSLSIIDLKKVLTDSNELKYRKLFSK